MTVDPSVVPGLLFLLAELVALAGVGYVIVRVALRETDHRVALAQGLIVGPAIWGVVVNIVMYALPGMAGSISGWIFVLALAAVLIWRSPESIRPRPRVATLFTIATLALFCIALASRQMRGIPAPWVHLGLAASIREGGFPPEFPWNPGVSVLYHHGADMLLGILAPPSGPDLAFTTEIIGAYAWVSLFLIVVTVLLGRVSGSAVLILVPLLLTTAMWTLMLPEQPTGVVNTVAPAGLPSAGLRASLADLYWPSVGLPYASRYDALPNISKPPFTLSYALAFVVLAQAARSGRRSWLRVITLAALTVFLGLTSSTLAPIVLVLWAVLEAVDFVKSRRAGCLSHGEVICSTVGLSLAAGLLLARNLAAFLSDGSVAVGLTFGANEFSGGWRLLGAFDRLPGGVGLVGLGPLTVAGLAGLLARRDRLVLALAAGAGILALASLMLSYEPAPWDVARIEGHARNFAVFALLLALGIRLAGLRPARWRWAVSAAIVILAIWPTAMTPVRNLGLAISGGIQLGNSWRIQQVPGVQAKPRYVLGPLPSDPVADYIRRNTAVDARVFSANPNEMTYATGRPNASTFVGLLALQPRQGPAYRDVRDHFEPAAVRRIGFEYVYATDSWVEGLPDEAAARLSDPSLFELLIRDESASFYRVLSAFHALDPAPAPGSHEALRRAVPASATVFLSKLFQSTGVVRAAWALSHAELFGDTDLSGFHLLRSWHIESLGNRVPDIVVASSDFIPWMFPTASQAPIWRNDEVAVYALNGVVEPIMPSPSTEPFPVSVRVSDVSDADGRIAFTATFDDGAPDQWTGQDWVLIATQAPPWHLPKRLLPNGSAAIEMWFDSHLNPGEGATSFAYEFDIHAPSLAVRREQDALKPLDRSEGVLDAGSYLLAVRLRHEYESNKWRDAALIPVLRITVSETSEVSYQVHEAVQGG